MKQMAVVELGLPALTGALHLVFAATRIARSVRGRGLRSLAQLHRLAATKSRSGRLLGIARGYAASLSAGQRHLSTRPWRRDDPLRDGARPNAETGVCLPAAAALPHLGARAAAGPLC